jgi:hypothetical protein
MLAPDEPVPVVPGVTRWTDCPVDVGKLPLESGCAKCKLCWRGPGDHVGVVFRT